VSHHAAAGHHRCYTGHVVLNRDISLADMPLCVPLLQRQQSRLHYYCNADGVPLQSSFSAPLKLVYDVASYAAECLASDALGAELGAAAGVNEWMDDDKNTFFGEIEVALLRCALRKHLGRMSAGCRSASLIS
jgi:hypothetical protein